MAHSKSQAVQNQEGSPVVINDPPTASRTIRQSIITAAIPAGNSGGDTYELIQVQSRVRVYSIEVVNLLTAGLTSVSCGLRRAVKSSTPLQISAAADAILFSARDFSSATKSWTQVFGSGAGGAVAPNLGSMAWELAGFSDDPRTLFSVILLINTTSGNSNTSQFRFTVSGEN